MNTIFEQMLSKYPIISDKDRRNAIYEVMHQITLVWKTIFLPSKMSLVY